MKNCIRCKKILPLSHFYKHKQMGDGSLNKCITCCKARTVWQNIHSRCYDVNYKDYGRYGARGIKVCSEWHKLENFEKWYFKNYKPKMQVDRIDNDGNYSPENCRMVEAKYNARNRSDNVLSHKILSQIDNDLCNGFKLHEISKKYNINRTTISGAINGKSWKDFKFKYKRYKQ